MDQDVAGQLQELHARVCKAIADPNVDIRVDWVPATTDLVAATAGSAAYHTMSGRLWSSASSARLARPARTPQRCSVGMRCRAEARYIRTSGDGSLTARHYPGSFWIDLAGLL